MEGLTRQRIAAGQDQYETYCSLCHGASVRSAGAVPDLRRMAPGTHEAFAKIVLEGPYASNGMAAFDDVLSERDVADIHAYIRARAEEDRKVAAGEQASARLNWFE